MKAATIILALALTGCATVSTESRTAEAAAWADAGTTAGGIAAGAVEANPLLSGSPGGIAAVLGAKLVSVKLIDRIDDPETRATALRINTSMWGGAAASNLALMLGATNPVGAGIGIATAIGIWRSK